MSRLQAIGCAAPVSILLYAVVGLLLLGQYGGKIINYVSSSGWEIIEGEIVASSVIDVSDTTGERYLPSVRYQYQIDGQTYTGDQIDLRGTIYMGNEEVAAERIRPYQVGDSVTLYANPANPAQSVLDRQVQPGAWWLVGAGAGLLLLSLFFGLMRWRSGPVAVPDPPDNP